MESCNTFTADTANRPPLYCFILEPESAIYRQPSSHIIRYWSSNAHCLSLFSPFFYFSSLFIILSALIDWPYMFKNIHALKPFMAFYHDAISIRLHILRYQIKIQAGRLSFVSLGKNSNKINGFSIYLCFVFFVLFFAFLLWALLRTIFQ